MKKPWQTIKKNIVYDNPWIQVEHHDVLNPSGNPGIYGKVHYKNTAIGILPLDENYNTWLVGQYRYPLDIYSWEIPEGGGTIGLDPLVSAKRELLEETGISAKNWKEIAQLHLSNSVSDEFGIAYVATGLSFGEAQPEETEDLQIKKIPFEKAFQMVMNGEITDVLAMITIMKAKYLMDQGEL